MFRKSAALVKVVPLLLTVILLVGCTPAATATLAPPPTNQPGNPASQNCIDQGGTLSIKERGDGGQYGVCSFGDNQECEEWAMLRGDCPIGGLPVKGYVTAAAQYCVIVGGSYAATGKANTPDEQGTCTLKNGTACDAVEYYNGACIPESASPSAPASKTGQIVFSSDREGNYKGIYVMNADGADAASLMTGDTNYFAGPWSPDGGKILFTGFGLTHSYVGVMNSDGSGETDLTQQPDSDEAFPTWSPDGTQIAFTSRRDGNNEIYIMKADGTEATRLTTTPGDDFAPSWSPDGKRIAFASDRDRTSGVYSLYSMNTDGSDVKRLTKGAGSDDWPAWSPDGTRIAFRSLHEGAADIFVINADGSGLVQLTAKQSNNWSPSWSPDGSQILFQSDRDGNWEIYIMNADGSDARNLTQRQSDDEFPYMKP